MKEAGANYTAASFTTVNELLRAAFAEAKRLGHKAVGPEHGLLVLLKGDDSAARRALVHAGLSVDLVEASFGNGWEASAGDNSVVANPAWYQVAGRTEGLGLVGGAVSTNFVIAMLWDEHKWARWEPEVPRDAVVAALQGEGVVTPSAPLPTLDRADTFTQKVDVPMEHLDRVVKELARRRHEEGGPRIGFNHDGEKGFVISEDGIDLEAVVNGIIASDE